MKPLSNVALACLSSFVFAAAGCSAAPGSSEAGDPELTSEKTSALTVADLGGLTACTISAVDAADCVVAPGYPVDSLYTFTTKVDDGSIGPTLQAKAYVTGKSASGTLIHLYGAKFDGVYSWKTKSDGTIGTKSLTAGGSSFAWYCLFGSCHVVIVGKEGPGPQ